MSASPIRLYSGEESVRAAEALRSASRERREQWPYIHIYPPPSSRDVHVVGAIQVQVGGGAALPIVTYEVPAGKRLFLRAVLMSANISFLPGDAFFTLDRNAPPSGSGAFVVGSPTSQIMPEHGLINVPFALGSITSGPWPLQRAREFGPLDIVRIHAYNVNLDQTAFWICGLFGYEVPVADIKAMR